MTQTLGTPSSATARLPVCPAGTYVVDKEGTLVCVSQATWAQVQAELPTAPAPSAGLVDVAAGSAIVLVAIVVGFLMGRRTARR